MQQKRARWKRNLGGQLRNMPHREATRVGTRDHTSMGLVGGERKGRRWRAAVLAPDVEVRAGGRGKENVLRQINVRSYT